MRIILAGMALACLIWSPARAHEFKAGEITIEHPWARPAASGNSAAYLELANAGSAPDRLLGASTPVAASAELHTSMIDANGVASMRPVQGVDIPAGGTAKLAAGGLHIMLTQLRQPLQVGQSFPLTLNFEHAGMVTVEVVVERKPSHAGADADSGAATTHQHTMPAN